MLKIRSLRIENGLTQKEMAQKIGTTDKNIWAYENDKAVPPLETLIKYSDYFSVTLDYLVGRTDETDGFCHVDVSTLPASSKEQQLIRCFRELPESSQDLILGMVKSAADAAKRA